MFPSNGEMIAPTMKLALRFPPIIDLRNSSGVISER
jgi:hypothetical protein